MTDVSNISLYLVLKNFMCQPGQKLRALPWHFVSKITNSKHQISNKFQIPIYDGFVKSDLLRWRPIFAESNSEKRPHCHFER